MVYTKNNLPKNTVEKNRVIVYSYFDEKVIPILKERMPETDIELNKISEEIGLKMKNYKWTLRKYNDTYRLSALAKNNYLYFMIWTPDDKEQFDNWDYEYHGSRRSNDGNS